MVSIGRPGLLRQAYEGQGRSALPKFEARNKKPSGRGRRVFERAGDLGVLAGAAENREAGQPEAHQQGAGGFGDSGDGVTERS